METRRAHRRWSLVKGGENRRFRTHALLAITASTNMTLVPPQVAVRSDIRLGSADESNELQTVEVDGTSTLFLAVKVLGRP
jgi:hypothetical protein